MVMVVEGGGIGVERGVKIPMYQAIPSTTSRTTTTVQSEFFILLVYTQKSQKILTLEHVFDSV